jgi:uncharacterized protein (DUF1330 family)
MEVNNGVYPTGQQLAAVMGLPGSGPIVMVNLLKFKEKAEYPDGRATTLTGREAYMLYGEKMSAFVTAKGGRIIFTGRIEALAIGEVGELWDVCALMEYPSAKAFVEIATSPEVQEFGVHRTAGLAGQLLLPCTTVDAP